MKVIPVINKIDLPSSNVSAVKKDLSDFLKIDEDRIIEISAKTGLGIESVLPEIIKEVPSPKVLSHELSKSYIVDSWFDNYLGVVVLIKVISGKLNIKDKIRIYSTKNEFIIDKRCIHT